MNPSGIKHWVCLYCAWFNLVLVPPICKAPVMRRTLLKIQQNSGCWQVWFRCDWYRYRDCCNRRNGRHLMRAMLVPLFRLKAPGLIMGIYNSLPSFNHQSVVGTDQQLNVDEQTINRPWEKSPAYSLNSARQHYGSGVESPLHRSSNRVNQPWLQDTSQCKSRHMWTDRQRRKITPILNHGWPKIS